MHLMISILVILVTSENVMSFLTAEWTESMRQFFQQTQQKIGEKSNQFLNGSFNFLFSLFQKN